MVVEVSKSFTHCCDTAKKQRYSEQELQDILVRLMERNGIARDSVSFTADGVLQVDDQANLKLHRIMLQIEEMGLEMKFTKKTLIEIC